MGKAFLALTAQYLKENYSAYHEVEIIFPTRRACSQFKKYFAAQFSTPIWMPNVLAIEDFITKYSENKIAEEWLLMMELYKIYSQLNPVTDFAEFYPWGKVILNDFDETDNYLIDADKLFATLRDLADIDKQFEWDDEQKQFIHDFWESLLGHNYDENTEGIRTHFINNWQYLLDLYKSFKAGIIAKGFVYKGLAMRQLVGKVVDENLFANRKIIFAGFYALSQSEEKLFSILQERNIATLLWDIDEYYIKDNAQEAGYYLRRQPYIKTTSLFRGTYFNDTYKTITATGTTLAYGQVQFASQCVEKILPIINDKEKLTAIVLPDEKLLFPLLRSLPPHLSSANITMGYPLKNSFVDSMLDAFSQLLLHLQHHKGGVMVSKFYFVQFVNQPASALLLNVEDINNYLANVSHGYFRLKNIETSFHAELFSLFEKEYKTADEIIDGIICIIQLIIDNGENKLSPLELDMFAFSQSKIIESKKSLQQYSQMLQPADVVVFGKANDTKPAHTFRRRGLDRFANNGFS
ncbi:MAG: hypothetical protein IPP29_11905 [Bacteroidetes bacterium]|nr:hypothetical protein [Bacteroidota bacterium]